MKVSSRSCSLLASTSFAFASFSLGSGFHAKAQDTYCTARDTTTNSTVNKIAPFDQDQDQLWVGNIVQKLNSAGRPASSISPSSIPSGSRRNPFQIASLGRTETVLGPVGVASYTTALSRLLGNRRLNDPGSSLGQVNFKLVSTASLQSAMVSIGAKASGVNWSASLRGSYTGQDRQNSVIVIFSQSAFSVVPDIGAQGAANTLVNGRVSDTWKADNAYISQISYGRLLVVKATSSSSLTELKAALNGAYTGVTTNASGNINASYTEILRNAGYEVVGIGGSNAAAQDFIAAVKSGNAASISAAYSNYFVNNSYLSSLRPLFVQRRGFDGNTVSSRDTYTELNETCTSTPPGKTGVIISYEFYLKDSDDGFEDEVFGTLTVNGQTPTGWTHTSSGKHVNLNEGETLIMHKDAQCTYIKSGPRDVDRREIYIKLDDYDPNSPNDRIFGSFTKEYDYSIGARAIKGGAPSYYYPNSAGLKNSDGNVFKIKFSPCGS